MHIRTARDDRSVVAVHNGIIENYQEIRRKTDYINGYTFYSDTDTEVAVKLIDHYYKKYNEGHRSMRWRVR